MGKVSVGISMSLDGFIAGPNEVAGDKDVAVDAASIAQQCIRAGLLDEVHINLVSVLLGGVSDCSSIWGPHPSNWRARG